MASNPTTRHELVAEIRAHAEASMIVRILGDTLNESGKRFTRSRPAQLERWLQLANCAREEANGLLALDRTPRRAVKPAGKATAHCVRGEHASHQRRLAPSRRCTQPPPSRRLLATPPAMD